MLIILSKTVFPILESEAQVADVAETQLSAEEPFVPGPPLKSDHSARPKIPSYPLTRRPAGGMSRPLPSPGRIYTFVSMYAENCLNQRTKKFDPLKSSHF